MATFNATGNKLTDGTNNVTLGGNFTTTGNAITLNATGSTNVTLPTSGTLVNAAGYPAVDVTGTTQAMAANTAYTANNAALVTLTLPATSAVGEVFFVIGSGAGGWKVAQNSGQSIRVVNGSTTISSTTGTGGYIASASIGDAVALKTITANTLFEVWEVVGNPTIV